MPLQPGKIIKGRFRIEGQLGKGGMGAVYLAYDQTLELRVAIKENLSPSPESERQFKREAILLARLRHPNLPRVSDHFIIEDRQYLVMDYIEGEDLQTYASQRSPSVAEVLAWADAVCNALTFLHTRQPPIIHRDIKPANIKLQPDGTIVLVDFGIAKEFSQATTTTGARGLTPGFSPPEQYGLQRTDAISDQYSLAATIYVLLTGDRPADSFKRLLKQGELKPARDLNPEIPEHVEAALQQALALQKGDRFPDIEGFRTALREQAPAETVFEVAQPTALPSRQRDAEFEALKEQARNLAEEEKWDEALATWREYIDLEPEDKLEAEAETKQLEQAQELALAYAAAQSAMEKEKYGKALRTLKSITIKDPTYRDVSSLLDQAKELRNGEKRLWQRPWLWGGMGVAIAVALIIFLARSPIPNSIIAALTRPTAAPPPPPAPPAAPIITSRSSPLPTSTPAPILTVTAQAHATELAFATSSVTTEPTEAASLVLSVERASHSVSVAWSPDGSRLATACHQFAFVWHATNGQRLREMSGNMDRMNSVAWSPNGLKLASTSYQVVWIWDYSSGSMMNVLWGHGDYDVNSVAWSPDGLLLASGADGSKVIIWEAASGKQLYALSHQGVINSVAWSPDSTQLASGGSNNKIMVWDATSGEHLYNLDHGSDVNSVAWSPDGTQLASGGSDGMMRVWDASNREQLYQRSHSSNVNSVAWSLDGTKLASGGNDKAVRVWDTASGKCIHVLRGYEEAVNSVAWSPDGTRLASASHEDEGGLRVWNIP